MSNYYDEILQEIKELIDAKEYEQAYSLLRKEKSMPYIPSDIEPKLDALLKDVRFYLTDKKNNTESNLDDLLEQLKGNATEQLLACNELSKKNLRDCIQEIHDYLESDPFEEAAAILVENIAEQQIQEEFTWIKDDVEYTFYGDSITPCSESKGFLKALDLIQEWFNKNPDMLEMAKTLLIHEVFIFLPLSYEEEDATSLAYDVSEEVCLAMNQEILLKEIQERANYHPQELN